MSVTVGERIVLVLGGGINGAAIARELAINGLGVVLVDRNDLAFGATAYSSRLIHGGLRYLEYGEFALVRESLRERARLLQLAPQFVSALELQIPIEHRLSGVRQSLARLLGWKSRRRVRGPVSRGLWLVRAGLWWYDRFARRANVPRHRVMRVGGVDAIPVDRSRYRWLCSFYDARVRFPERLVMALLCDAREEAQRRQSRFDVHTYCEVTLESAECLLRSSQSGQVVSRFRPAAIINATGAWLDETLRQLHIPSRTLLAGTKGSHFFTSHPGLRDALAGRGIYGEARDGRPVFLLPWVDGSMVGTTDLPFEGDPARAEASPQEIEYLLATVNGILPEVRLTATDVDLHYCGVRPLPHSTSKTAASITRRHGLEEHDSAPLPMYSVIGGKLTTCRSLAAEVATKVLEKLKTPRTAQTDTRLIPGAENYPKSAPELHDKQGSLARQYQLSLASVRTLWELLGTRAEPMLATWNAADRVCLPDSDVPEGLARFVIQREWASRLGDLVERRLMLLYDRRLSRAGLRRLAELLVDEHKLAPNQIEDEVRGTVERLSMHFGKRIAT